MLDGAGWHTAEKLRESERIPFESLPSHSPEPPPSDRGVANRHFERIEDLEVALVERYVALGDQPEAIRSYARYH